jgi:ATP-dependent helicase/nuclease subunit A
VADLFVITTGESSDANAAGLPPDWQEREHALDVRQSWIVEAPAGSGKTGLLIQRYLKLLADESVEEPEQVLAITFTVKATAEMRERVMAQLEAAARGDEIRTDSEFDRATREMADAVLRRDESLGWGLLEHPRRLKIRTIDSVCGEIARLLPVLSGGGGRLTPVDDPTPMYREAARQTLMQLGGADVELNVALRTVLLHRDGSLAECERLLMEMLPLRNQWGGLVPLLGREEMNGEFLDREVLPQLQRALEEVVCAGLTEFAQAVPAYFLHALASLATSLAQIEPYERERSPIEVCSGKVGIPSTDPADLEHWRALIHLLVTPSSGMWRKSFAKNTLGFEMTPQQKKSMKALLEEVAHRDDLLHAIEKVNRLPPAVYPQEQWVVAKALFRVLSRALAELKVVFARTGECDFAEWGLLAEAALREDGAVEDLNAALGMKLQHLLVDEMQDTSTSQYELIQLLTQGWDGHSQTVFLVGDPKQSIYLFRQARVERFVRTMQTQSLADLPLGHLQLMANFRSQRELVHAFNADFSLLFPRNVNAASPEEVPYVEAQAVRGPTKNGAQSTVWHTRVLAADERIEDKAREKKRQAKAQAREVREIIEDWRARPLPEGRTDPWKIAVLVRSRNVLPEIVAELNDETRGSVPFRAVDIEALGERQEVLDLFALTRALLHPADRVAWFAVLHAPWCGLGLADLHTLAGEDDPTWAERCMEDVIAERGHLLTEESCARLMRVWPVLRAAEEYRAGLTTAQWVERTWRSLGGDAYLKQAELANARRYLQLLDEVEQQAGTMDLRLLQRRLDKLFAEPAAGTDMVDLMTIHGAKGLEWDVVIVPGLEKRAQANREKLLTWSEIDLNDERAAHIVLAPIAERGEGSKELNAWLRSIDKAREAAERKRLFYVACTRAREELHLFASPEMTAKGEINRAYGSLLSTAWPAAERHFATVETAATRPAQSGPLATMLVTSMVDESAKNREELVIELAAAGAEQQEEGLRHAMLQRLPIGFDPSARFAAQHKLPYGDDGAVSGTEQFNRPEGSFEARAFGNAVHAFVEMLTKRFSDGDTTDDLLREILRWPPRVAAVLRGDGLPPPAIDRLTARVQTALGNMLRDPQGLWLLGPRDQASSEFALTSWGDKLASLRMDRVFLAGENPLAAGNEFLWIIDYKTTSHGRENVDEFLAAERAKYSSQMEAYAVMMKDRMAPGKARVGLYYAMLPRLIWWEI